MPIMPLLAVIVPLCALTTVWAQSSTATVNAPAPVSTICGDIVSYANENLTENFLFQAVDAFECLRSVPFLDAVAHRYIEYYNTTIQFQSTLAYLKNPPIAYQQPAIDVLAALEQIKRNVTAGYYTNRYDFEATLQSLVLRMHDSHVTLDAGVLSAFSFGSPQDLISLPVDGRQAPQICLANDYISSQGGELWTPSPMELINGADAIEYLREFAARNSEGSSEAHTDWNQLFYTPVQDILGNGNVFGWHATFYPNDELVFTFANHTRLDTIWIALYNNLEQTGPLATGGDFYNYFVLGLLPASYVEDPASDSGSGSDGDADNTADNDGTQRSPGWSDFSDAYPSDPFVEQDNLETTGYVTGYFLNGTSTAVLSIPSFESYGDAATDFSTTIGEFIEYAIGNGTSRVVIDLQQNAGGSTLLAFDTFRHFFPNIDPFGGSRRRSFPLEGALGNALTNFWKSLAEDSSDYDQYYYDLSDDEWVITDRINAETGQDFTSWQQYYGPARFENDDFSLIERYNLSSDTFTIAATGGNVFLASEGAAAGSNPAWRPSEIVLLTDGLCASTCAIFAEMMTHEAGVRSVVVGGASESGPMQAVSGSRGAIAYSADILDTKFGLARSVDSAAEALIPQVREQAISTDNIGFNLRDQIRQGSDVPL